MESADIVVQANPPFDFVLDNAQLSLRVTVKATAKYGVAEVFIKTVNAAQSQFPEDTWIAVIPAEPNFETTQPISVRVTDRYGNSLVTQL